MIEAISLCLSLSAAVLSVVALLDNRRKDRRDNYLKLHEMLISEDRHRGRQIMYMRCAGGSPISQIPEGERAMISRAIATYDAVGLYVKRGYVDENDVMDTWADSVQRAWRSAQPFIVDRRDGHGVKDPWPFFRYLAQRAERYISANDNG